MTPKLTILGFVGTLLIVAALGMAIVREPARQVQAAQDIRTAAVAEGLDLYATNCVACHGAAGEGIAAYPALDSEGVRLMDADDIFRTIERGRYNTAMAAYGAEEGGIFTDMQIRSLVALIQEAPWDAVAARVDELGLTPPPVAAAEIDAALLADIQALPEGDVLANGLQVYATNCVACHGANGEGTNLAPALNTDELRARLTDADITRIITQGAPGTLMASWARALSPEEIDAVTMLVRRWPELDAAGVTLPVVEAAPIDMSPEAIASGAKLYNILCTQCHGADGYGSRLAPALNNQTFLNQTPDAAIQQIIAGGVSGTSMPAWGGYLTEADIAAITAYLRSMESTAPAMATP
ncbi:MAG TPA: c-type cytochrome [Chloroflexi bacterium]|nr:c-type cytochrome [Chloroflexota bacterium]